MTDNILKQIWPLISGLGAFGMLAFGAAILVTKGAIATGVQALVADDLARLKNDLAADLQRERQKFDLALASLKAELTLPAEVRRQVAARKVDAVGTIITLGRKAIKAADTKPPEDTKALSALGDQLWDTAHLFRAEVAKQFRDHAALITTWLDDPTYAASNQVIASIKKLEDVARKELYVE
jgi:hypothetical protein